jgi:hypothetical protein
MLSATECKHRAEECRRKAASVADEIDRARWRSLAEQWTLLGQIPFYTRADATKRAPVQGLWRGDLRKGGADYGSGT